MKGQLPSQTLEEQFLSPSTRKAPLSESIRLGKSIIPTRRLTRASWQEMGLGNALALRMRQDELIVS
jgi:hypothetical protein